ncbi:hypothetical protein OP10G_4373 [Fimbriimonas ginsengisoli Gsoil 348]|uniref:Uncharacterized protein n=1 Tax=Fimbriimonas ginsengisoli Gsoil 348 TaxID=661478 RepID=A0A068NWB1_FIMGI|nr:hypothetical protein OP10G_4373 [Fimbriimonas ginsengisoli Gsoil 348]
MVVGDTKADVPRVYLQADMGEFTLHHLDRTIFGSVVDDDDFVMRLDALEAAA